MALLLCAGCGSDERTVGQTVDREGPLDVTYVADDDPEMVAAMEKAKLSLGQFIEAFASPKPSQVHFAVKVLIKDGERGEFMWANAVQYSDGKFTATIGNDPDRVTTVKLGDTVTVSQSEIADWMYVDNSRLVGNFTLRVLRKRMTDAERSELDESVPFTFD